MRVYIRRRIDLRMRDVVRAVIGRIEMRLKRRKLEILRRMVLIAMRRAGLGGSKYITWR
jgi:hypothetical protein